MMMKLRTLLLAAHNPLPKYSGKHSGLNALSFRMTDLNLEDLPTFVYSLGQKFPEHTTPVVFQPRETPMANCYGWVEGRRQVHTGPVLYSFASLCCGSLAQMSDYSSCIP